MFPEGCSKAGQERISRHLKGRHMSLIINHNMMAMNAARNLSDNYGALSTSTQRLSSGLRINSAADDAAGLAVRELMRSDIATMNQGVRNANDAVSMIQTADGGLQIIDEKLTRMKELAEQAATGTYTSDQRLIIDSEYQAMASEIQRIAVATDFNGIKLLDESLWFGNYTTGTGDFQNGVTIHFGTGNDSAEDYYSISTTRSMEAYWLSDGLGLVATTDRVIERAGQGAYSSTMSQNVEREKQGLPLMTSTEADQNRTMINNDLSQYVGDQRTAWIAAHSQTEWDNLDYHEKQRTEIGWAKEETSNIVATGNLSSGEVLHGWGSWVGQGADSWAGSFDGNTVYTQDDAQKSLGVLDKAMVQVNNNRARFGAYQNRLENTISNIQIQAENLQAAESQISDTDVASEMTSFVKEQILTQAATAMLSQANSMPKMALQLIQG